jgi:phenylalanyl-tRNA synthetase alpha chain
MEILKEHIDEVNNFESDNTEAIELFRIKYLSKNGIIANYFKEFKKLSENEKKDFGKEINDFKNATENKLKALKDNIKTEPTDQKKIDLTLPAEVFEIGARHPVSIVWNEIVSIFKKISFSVYEGPHIEDDWHNFGALNFPSDHPARDMQDTFFIEKNPDIILRTHTSSVQIRAMESNSPPIRIIMPGRTFRNEAISARAYCTFHQVEGLYIDRNVSFADLKQTLAFFAKEMFGADTKIRLRPSYFPFTEPSAEMDISCTICNGKGCKICKNTGWLEIMGCGMVDPSVLENTKMDPKIYSGFAFGMGIDRIAMLKYQVKDIRLFFENDVRFLKQFSSAL